MHTETEAVLCNEFQTWCDAQGLPQMSADELLHEDITPEQRAYLSAFYGRWEAMRKDRIVADVNSLFDKAKARTDREIVKEAALALALAITDGQYDKACRDMVEVLRYARSKKWWEQEV